MDKRPGRLRNRPGHFWEQQNIFPMPQNEGFLGCTARGPLDGVRPRVYKIAVHHIFRFHNRNNWLRYLRSTLNCLGSLVHTTHYTPLLPSTYTAIELSPFWDFVSLKRCLHYSLTPARLLHPSPHRTRNASLQTTSPRLAIVLHFCLPWMKSNLMGITEMKIAHHTISLRPPWNILFQKVYMGPRSRLRPQGECSEEWLHRVGHWNRTVTNCRYCTRHVR